MTTTVMARHDIAAELDRQLRWLDTEARRFGALAAVGDLGVPIAACPGWDLRELVRHVGLVHLWAAANVAVPSDRWLAHDGLEDLRRFWPELTTAWPSDDDLADWYRATAANLVDVLRSAPSDHCCLAFLPAPTPVLMWARRQASEIGVHRHDAEAALGLPTQYGPDFATDMLDELLVAFAPRLRAPGPSDTALVHVDPDDVEREWFLTLGPDGVRPAEPDRAADLRLTGTAAELYLLLWNRPPGPTVGVHGDAALLDRWSEACRVTWI